MFEKAKHLNNNQNEIKCINDYIEETENCRRIRKQEEERNEKEKSSSRTDKITIYIYSYKYSVSNLKNYVDNITEKYLSSIKKIKDLQAKIIISREHIETLKSTVEKEHSILNLTWGD